jgi:hypothetical protein
MTLATIALLAQLAPLCYGGQAVQGQRIVVGQFPYFSCLERDGSCQLRLTTCTPSEVALVLGLGGVVQNPVYKLQPERKGARHASPSVGRPHGYPSK